MNISENITNLLAAMHGLQLDIRDASKDNQAHNYKYADLGQILQLARPLLHEHGLVALQSVSGGEDCVSVTTTVCHVESGEFFSDTLTMPVSEARGMSRAQAAGSVITYARRYALATSLGITQVDDDAAPAKTSTESQTDEQELW